MGLVVCPRKCERRGFARKVDGDLVQAHRASDDENNFLPDVVCQDPETWHLAFGTNVGSRRLLLKHIVKNGTHTPSELGLPLLRE